MSGSYEQSEGRYGALMALLLKERARFETDEEFRSFAVESVRKFITDLREFSIECSIRPMQTGGSTPTRNPREEVLG
jgi:hypothetical protein